MSLPSKERLLETAFNILEGASGGVEWNNMQTRRAEAYIKLAREVPDTKAKDRPFSEAADL